MCFLGIQNVLRYDMNCSNFINIYIPLYIFFHEPYWLTYVSHCFGQWWRWVRHLEFPMQSTLTLHFGRILLISTLSCATIQACTYSFLDNQMRKAKIQHLFWKDYFQRTVVYALDPFKVSVKYFRLHTL